jgi:hypothetical protein
MNAPNWLNPDAVRLLVGGLVGKQIPARPGTAITPSPRTPMAIAEYVTDDGSLGGLVICDLALAASLGAALILLPPNSASDAVRANKLPEQLAENFQEVLNVASRWFNAPLRPHVKLGTVHWNQGGLPARPAEYLKRVNTRLDVSLAVPGYATGTLSILTGA